MRGNSTTVRYSRPVSLMLAWAAVLVASAECSTEAVPADWVRFRLTVTTPLVYRNVPMDPAIDFDAVIRQAGLRGVADLNSVEVINVTTGE